MILEEQHRAFIYIYRWLMLLTLLSAREPGKPNKLNKLLEAEQTVRLYHEVMVCIVN